MRPPTRNLRQLFPVHETAKLDRPYLDLRGSFRQCIMIGTFRQLTTTQLVNESLISPEHKRRTIQKLLYLSPAGRHKENIWEEACRARTLPHRCACPQPIWNRTNCPPRSRNEDSIFRNAPCTQVILR